MNNDNNISEADKKVVIRRLHDARLRMLIMCPFYGNLILHLKFTLAQCGTAATDMRRILFDPCFIMRLKDEEIDFVIKHEIMHCVLQHCVRGKDKDQFFYNVACDVVVNSSIMNSMGVNSLSIDGEEVIHLTPDGYEGRLFSVEEVYEKLMSAFDSFKNSSDAVQKLLKEYGSGTDAHDIWDSIPYDVSLENEWKSNMIKAAKVAGDTEEIPPIVRSMIWDFETESRLNWREVLSCFIKEINDRYDFSFVPPDRRFASCDFMLPSFSESQSEAVDNIWFVVDTSGSISNWELQMAMGEIKSAIEQFNHLSGMLSFFDTRVSEPVSFDSVDVLEKMEPVGGGGTSFDCIFKSMSEYFGETLPTAIIVLTDGYAKYPAGSVALGVPVLWIIAGENDEDAPWGVTIHIE